ncbi:hypothetical protein HXX76_007289 [Chlamydomonas incerta]|uniref:Nuclear pore complex protein NUP96 C-terminal domain-containing protein n=1 Tax=Chlamydomonas incerta TaxID=51695 RepID=A0A835W458_CHLIN|nr:hypothetical protein HXX76_007289 [Chlamydomonas incerta]|eukprot:KAG2435206.1 hypothetical protein HXX76_007289 [Chlamydomonas incerta]
MSEARAQLRFGDDPTAEAEVSGGVVGPPAAGGSMITGSIAMGGGGFGGGGFGGGGGAADAAMAEPAPAAVPLQHALPASLAHDPVRVRALHDAFFGGGGGGGGGGTASAVAGDGWTQQPQPHHHHHHRQAMQAAGSMISGALPMGGAGEAARGGAATAAAAAAALREGGGATSAAPSGPMATTWRRPAAALSAGAPAAVMARGAALLSEVGGGDSGGGAGAAGAGSPISLALARAVTVRPPPSAPEGAAGAVLPLKEVATARYLTDAGLAMGRSFRVGWGPGGKLVVPGAAEATTATEICVTRVRVEGEGAAYGEVSGGGAGDGEEAEGLEALRERLRAALEVHLAASKPREWVPAAGAGGGAGAADADGDVAVTDAAVDGGSAAAPSAAAAVPPHWRLCVDNRELAVLVERYVRVCEQQLHSLLGGGGGGAAADGGASGGGGAAAAAAVDADHPDAARLRHEIDTWRLVEVLFARIDGEVPEESTTAGPADHMSLSTPPATPGNALAAGGDHDMATAAGSTTGDGAAAPRTLLAALQRRAALGLWLQRQARRRVEEDLAALPHGSSPAAVALHLLAAHQLAAAAGAAVAAGDTRLALLISRAGGRSSAKQQLAAQLTLWQQQGFSEHIAPERLAAYHLMAGQVLETQRLLSLDWRRLLGLQLWYAAAPTSSPLTALQRYLMDRHTEPGVVPHPAPYHVEGLQPSATGAGNSAGSGGSGGATDVQWELLQLWSTTPAAATADCLADGRLATAPGVAAAAERAREGWLAGGGCSRLLRCAGYSPNPLDHSLAWHLMTSLQACRVLPKPGGHGADAHAGSPPPAYESELLATTLEFISQLLLAGGLCEWALYVALTIPDLPVEEGAEGGGGAGGAGAGEEEEEAGGGRSPAVRTRVVRELLAMTAPEWMGDGAREAFLTNTLRIPAPLLAEARATWAHYARDDAGRCAALLAAGSVAAAHDVFSASVAPGLFLAGAWEQLAALVAALEPAAAALPAWSSGGGLYGNFLALFGRQLTAAAAGGAAAVAAAAPPGVGMQELLGFAAQVQEAQLGLDPRVGGGGGAAAAVAAADEAAERSRLRRRLVLGRMAARVHGALMSCSVGGPGGAAAGWEERSVGLQAGLALQGCLAAELQLGGVAVAVAEAGARVAACSS